MNTSASRINIKASPFWRVLPNGMRRRWWLFRAFDLLVRYLSLPKRRRGLLAVRMDGIGDMVLFRTSLEHYTRAFGIATADITVLGCNSWRSIADEVFKGYRVICINEHAYARQSLYRFFVNLKVRALAPSITVIDAYFRRAMMADSLAWVANAPRTVVALPYINERTRAEYTWYLSQGWEVIDTGPYPTHEIVRHAAFLSHISGHEFIPEPPSIRWPARVGPAYITAPYAVLNPGSNEYGRRWPISQFVELARWLRRQGLEIVFVGKATEKVGCDELIHTLAKTAGVHDLTGRSTLDELLDVMKGAALVVSNDTGPAHVSIALGTSTVIVVGGGHFGCFVPYPESITPDHARFVHERMDCYHCFWRCHKRDDPKAPFPCVKAVPMAKVQEACADLLAITTADGTPA